MSEKTWYAEWFERNYSAVLGMVRYFFTQLADEAVEIAGRSVALAAPLPNAISMYNISQKELGYNWLAAMAFALMIELIVFFLVEVALYMWSGYLKDPRRYKVPFQASIAVVLVAVFVVMGLVGILEPHKIMAALPIISLCSFVGIGLKRWHERNLTVNLKPVKSAVKSTDDSVKFDSVDSENFTPSKVDTRRQSLLAMLKEIDGQSIDVLNKSALAKRLDVSRPTLLSDLAALESDGKLTLNGHVKVG